MDIEEVSRVVGDTPNMTLAQARGLKRLISQHRLSSILELGFGHGAGTCYLGSIAKERGGRVTAIDLAGAQEREPNIRDLLDRCHLDDFVDVYFEPTSYTWRLMKFLEEDPAPRFDFCYLDAAHSWFVDGFGFFLVDRLLKDEGWIVFDDLDWTFGASPTVAGADWVMAMPGEERDTPQVRKVYELLVKPHPDYTDFRVDGGWAYARKRTDASRGHSEVRTEFVLERPDDFLKRTGRSILRNLSKRKA